MLTPLFGFNEATVRVRGTGADPLSVSEYAPVTPGSNELAQIVYVPVVCNVMKPLPDGMRELVPPPPSSSTDKIVPSGLFKKRKVSNADDCINTETCVPAVALKE